MVAQLGRGRQLSTLAVKNLKLGKGAPAAAVKATEVLVKMVASPINSSDLVSSTSGSEGVGMVAAKGDKVTALREGDWVLPAMGTAVWTSEMVVDQSKLVRVSIMCLCTVLSIYLIHLSNFLFVFKNDSASIPVKQAPEDIPAAYAANLSGDLATAYRLLHDFAELEAGDIIIQNDAFSSVGMAVIQMASQMGVKTVNIVSNDIADIDTKLRLLTNLGGTVNVTDAYFGSHEYKSLVEGTEAKLLLVGDDVGVLADMARASGKDSTIVSYAGKSPSAEVAAFLKDEMKVNVTSFSIADWHKGCTVMDRAQMNANLATMVRTGHLTMFYEEHDLDDFDYALDQARESHSLRKVVLRMDFPDRLEEHDARDGKEYEVFETDVV